VRTGSFLSFTDLMFGLAGVFVLFIAIVALVAETANRPVVADAVIHCASPLWVDFHRPEAAEPTQYRQDDLTEPLSGLLDDLGRAPNVLVLIEQRCLGRLAAIDAALSTVPGLRELRPIDAPAGPIVERWRDLWSEAHDPAN
jgi:hypothetical protein